MSIFDVVDLNVAHRKSSTFALGEPEPAVFDTRVSVHTPAREASGAGEPHAGRFAWGLKCADGREASWEIYVVWFVWFSCTMAPPVKAIKETPSAYPAIPFSCDWSFLALFVTFPGMCVDAFCKCVVYGRVRRTAVTMHAVSVLLLVVTVQKLCLVGNETHKEGVFVGFCAGLVLASCSQVLMRGEVGVRGAPSVAFLGACVLTICSGGVAGVAYNLADGGQQQRIFQVQQLLLLGGIACYCAGTALTLSPVFMLCAQLYGASRSEHPHLKSMSFGATE
jgi:hypothetical protein